MSAAIEEVMQREKGLLPNVDFYSATVYHAMGIPTDLFTPVFAMSRVAGWCAHVLEQYANNRIYRPRGALRRPDRPALRAAIEAVEGSRRGRRPDPAARILCVWLYWPSPVGRYRTPSTAASTRTCSGAPLRSVQRSSSRPCWFA